jgi:hypothetical protein
MRMKLQRMPEPGLCLPTSFAMTLGVPVARLLDRLHGWHQVVFKGLPEPLCWRGIHIQELIRLALDLHCAVTPHELFPQIAGPYDCENYHVVFDGIGGSHNWDLFCQTIAASCGVLTGKVTPLLSEPIDHAVAYDHGRLFDPNGFEYDHSLDECEQRGFYGSIAWRIDRIVGDA